MKMLSAEKSHFCSSIFLFLAVLAIDIVSVAFAADSWDSGKLCAFLDVNGDQYTDIVTISTDRNSFSVKKASIEDFSFLVMKTTYLPKSVEAQKIVNCAVGDFDGDSFPDILISTVKNDPDTASLIDAVCICFAGFKGEEEEFSCDFCQNFEEPRGQPTVLDYNLDFVTDFYTPLQNGSNVCFAHVNRTKFSENACFSGNHFVVADFVHSYVDLDQDYNAEFLQPVISSDTNYPVKFLVWKREDEIWKKDTKTSLPDLSKQNASPKLLSTKEAPAAIGYPIIGDFDGDGHTDLLVPICENVDCSEVSILSWNNASAKVPRWMKFRLYLNQSEEITWRIVGAVKKSVVGPKKLSILDARIQVGDFTLDGYPDLLLLLESKDKKREVFLAENIACSQNLCDGWSRSFEIRWHFAYISQIPNEATVSRAVFFDLAEDGNLDLILEYTTKKEQAYKFQFLQSEDKGDTSFLKAEVFTGTCGSECKNGYRIGGSGISAPGGTLLYEIIDADGSTLRGIHGQLSQSSYNSLQLPYALFGLGRSPNFVETLAVGIPQNVSMHKIWTQIVPNARLYVIPYPPGSPNEWKSKMYLTPSRLILLSFAALCCVCGVILIMIVFLHWRERRQDKREKEQQAHKFNFDAM